MKRTRPNHHRPSSHEARARERRPVPAEGLVEGPAGSLAGSPAVSPAVPEDRRAARRSDLLDAAIACIRRVGAEASMDQIAAEARVTKPILYRFFRDKGDLYQAVAERYVGLVRDGLRVAMEGTGEPRGRLEQGIDAYLSLVEREPEIYRFLMQRARFEHRGAADEIENFVRRLGTEIGVVLGEQLADAGADTGGAEVWGHALVGMVNAAGDWWAERRTVSRPRLVRYLADLLWGGFSAMTGPAGQGGRR